MRSTINNWLNFLIAQTLLIKIAYRDIFVPNCTSLKLSRPTEPSYLI